MKRISIILTIGLLASITGWSQENMLTISGGYAFANLADADVNANGFRVNGLYEFNPSEGKLSHGLSFGYIGTQADAEGIDGVVYDLNNWPLYYAPKYMFGSGKFKPYVKGAMGLHFSGYKRTGDAGEIKSKDTGFYGGASAGAMLFFKENMFLMAEYEWAYMSNAWYQNGFINTANFGLGMKF